MQFYGLSMDVRQYFDDWYYLKSYPEVSQFNISPYDHYRTMGWKEGKNPRADFDNDFYLRVNNSWHRSIGDCNPLEHSVKLNLEGKFCYTNPSQLLKAKPLSNCKYYLALVAIFRDEARFLKEWIEFYKLMGVERFYLYNHLSQDNYMEVLAPYIADGTVELNHLVSDTIYPMHWCKLQLSVYERTIRKIEQEVEWLIIVDTDEFIVPVKEQSLVAALKKYDDYASVCVNWRLFGSSGVSEIPSDKLMIETLTNMGVSDNVNYNELHVKSIVKPRYVKGITQPHSVVLSHGYEQVTENYEYFYGPHSPYASNNILTINHYWSRDLEFFYRNKLSRVHLVHTLLDKSEEEVLINKLIKNDRDYSAVPDDLIARFVPALRDKVFR